MIGAEAIDDDKEDVGAVDGGAGDGQEAGPSVNSGCYLDLFHGSEGIIGIGQSQGFWRGLCEQGARPCFIGRDRCR